MGNVNVEVKAVCRDAEAVRRILRRRRAEFRGTDHQVDTYFRVPHGRLKLREGDIENHLIWYARPNERGPRRAEILLYPTQPGSPLKEMLAQALGVLAVVDKRREIYFIGTVKFHVDDVEGLGSFVEIEAQSPTPEAGRSGDRHLGGDASEPVPVTEDALWTQCRRYMGLLGIGPRDLIGESYSDMVQANSAQRSGRSGRSRRPARGK